MVSRIGPWPVASGAGAEWLARFLQRFFAGALSLIVGCEGIWRFIVLVITAA